MRAVDGGSATDETLSWLDGSNADAREGCNGRDSEAAVVAAWPAQPYRNRRRGRDHDASQWCGVDQSRRRSGGGGFEYGLGEADRGYWRVYLYCDGRGFFIWAVFDRQVELILAAQPAIHHADSWAGLRRWADQVLESHRVVDGPFACPLGSMAAELKNDDAYLPHLDAAFRRWEEPLARGLEVMRERGQLTRQSNPDRLAQSIVAAVQGGLMMAQIHDDGAVFEDAVENALLSLRRRATPRRRPVAAKS